MAYAQITKTTKTHEVEVEFERGDDDYTPERAVNIWFGNIEIYVSLSLAEAEELANKILEGMREDAVSA